MDDSGDVLRPPATALRLVIPPGDRSFELTRGGVVFGRHSAADVRLPLPDVSRFHCRFDVAGGRWEVVDLDSLNGVHVNDCRVSRAVLGHRDRLRLGGFVFEVDLRAGDPTVTLPPGEAGESGAVLRSIADALGDEDCRTGAWRRAS